MDPNVLKLERNKHNIISSGEMSLKGVLVILLLCCISCLCYKVEWISYSSHQPHPATGDFSSTVHCDDYV